MLCNSLASSKAGFSFIFCSLVNITRLKSDMRCLNQIWQQRELQRSKSRMPKTRPSSRWKRGKGSHHGQFCMNGRRNKKTIPASVHVPRTLARYFTRHHQASPETEVAFINTTANAEASVGPKSFGEGILANQVS